MCSTLATSAAADRSAWRLRHRWTPARPGCRLLLRPPPDLGAAAQPPRPPPPTTPEQKLANLFGNDADKAKPERTIAHQKNVGNVGSVLKTRATLLEPLALGGSTPAEGLDETLMKFVYGLSFMAWNEFGLRQLIDRRWCDAYADAARHLATRQPPSGQQCHVCVFGLGACIAALAAARAGCSVFWVERIARFAEVARSLVTRNGLDGHVRVARVKRWAETVHNGPTAEAPRFDAIVTDEVRERARERRKPSASCRGWLAAGGRASAATLPSASLSLSDQPR